MKNEHNAPGDLPLMSPTTLGFIESLLDDIRGQVNDYGTRLLTMDMGTGQGVRDHLAVYTAQLADMYGDIVTEHELAKAKYVNDLRERQRELWQIYQMDNPEINPEGKLSRTAAQDKARYQAVIDLYPQARRIAKLKGLEERANGLWRYTIPKLQDSIASRIALTREYPEGVPTTAMPMSRRHKTNFDILFGDIEDQTEKAVDAIDGLKNEYSYPDPNEIPDDIAFNNPEI